MQIFLKNAVFVVLFLFLLFLSFNSKGGGDTNIVAPLVQFQGYFFDENNKEDIQTVKSVFFTPGSRYFSVVKGDSSVWFKYIIQNKTGENIHLTFDAVNIDRVAVFVQTDGNKNQFSESDLTKNELQDYFDFPKEVRDSVIYIKIINKPFLNASPNILTTKQLVEYQRRKATISSAANIIYAIVLLSSILFIFINPENIFNKFIVAFTIFRIIAINFLTNLSQLNLFELRISKEFFLLIFLFDRATLYLVVANIFKHRLNINIKKNTLTIAFFGYVILGIFVWALNTNYFLNYIFYGMCLFTCVNIFLFCIKLIKLKEEKKPYGIFYLVLIAYLIGIQSFVVIELSGFDLPLIIKNNFINVQVYINVSALLAVLIFFSYENINEINIKKNNLITIKEQLRQEEIQRKRQQSFMSMLLHELNTPLSVIKLGIHTTLRRGQFNSEEEARLKRINAAVEDLNQIIANCVTADKYAENNPDIKLESILVNEFLEDILENYGLSENADVSRINFQNRLTNPHQQYIKTDPNYLRIILINLIKNALIYSPPSSTLCLNVENKTHNEVNFVEFQIVNLLLQDAKPDLNLLFQRYYRSEDARKFAGTGLGLWLSQTLAERLGTKIIVSTSDKEINFSFRLSI
jgi:signal transduction histidine kinase